MILTVDTNPNCELPDPRVFQERSEPVRVSRVLRVLDGKEVWCPVSAWGEKGSEGPAYACKVDDSGEGTCYLVYGGRWGVRLTDPGTSRQWGEAFLLLPSTGADLKFDKI